MRITNETPPANSVNGSVELLANAAFIRLVLAGFREALEEVPLPAIQSRLGESVDRFLATESTVRALYRSLDQAQSPGPVHLTFPEVADDIESANFGLLRLSCPTAELSLISRLLIITLDALDDYEFKTRVGFSRKEVEDVVALIEERTG